MAIASTNSYAPTVDEIIKQAMVLSTLMNANQSLSSSQFTADATSCRNHLADILHELPTRGAILREVRLTTQTLTAADYTYSLDAGIIDVLGDATYIDADATDITKADGETYVKQIGLEEWNNISSKAATSATPTLMYVHRGGTVIELRLWPVPTEAGTLRYKAHTKGADVQDGSTEVDLETYWRSYLTFEVAYRYALSKGLGGETLMHLGTQAKDKLKRARVKSFARVAKQPSVGYDTGWGR